MPLDYEKEIVQVMELVKPEYDYTFAAETLGLAAVQLERIDRRYGPESDNAKDFHDVPHSLGVARRTVILGNILYPYIHPIRRRRFFDGGIIVGTFHDDEQDLGPGENEAASSVHALHQIETADGVLNSNFFKRRVEDGIGVTAVRMNEHGKLIQVNLRRGSHDPLKFDAAFADINGIAMEGEERMLRDATALYRELTADPTDEGLYAFLAQQKKFIRGRLNDGQIKTDIKYYFPGDVDDVYKDMRRAFRGNILSAFNMARLLGERPELKQSVGEAVRQVGAGRVLGPTIGKLIRSKSDQQK
jgi:hypothetical protein